MIGTRANPLEAVHIEDEKEIKEYADASVQATPVPTPSTEISIQTDESTMAGLPAYTPRLEDQQPSKYASSSSSESRLLAIPNARLALTPPTLASVLSSSWRRRRVFLAPSLSILRRRFVSRGHLQPSAEEEEEGVGRPEHLQHVSRRSAPRHPP